MRAALFALLVLPAAGVPDVLLPGHKSVRHDLVLTWNGAVGDWRFVASPTQGFHGHEEIRAGEPFGFSSKYGTRIFAVPAAEPLPAELERLRDVPWPDAAVPVAEVRSIATGHPLARIETTLRIVAVTADDIEFERVGERRFDVRGNELGDLDWLPLVLIAGVGALWTFCLGRRGANTGVGP